MKFYLRIFAASMIVFFSDCSHDKQDHVKVKKHTSIGKTKKSSNPDTLLINSRSAISVLLDSAGLEKRKKKYGDTAYYVGGDDDMYYSYIADSVLNKKGLKIVEALNYKYLKFIQNNGSTTLIRIDTLTQLYNLFLFDPSKAPHITDITAIEDEYNKFYRN
jgi:hypothetical protein